MKVNKLILRKIHSIYRVLIQLLSLCILILSAFILIEVKWPGHQTYTDNDAGIFYISTIVFLCSLLFVLLNSILFFVLKHLPVYRFIIVLFSIFIFVLVLLPREYFVKGVLGEEKTTYESKFHNESNFFINLRLFENEKFLSESSNIEYTIENIGRYLVNNDTLILKFENKKSEFIGNKFLKTKNILRCLDCIEDIELEPHSETKQSIHLHDFPELNIKSVLEHLFI